MRAACVYTCLLQSICLALALDSDELIILNMLSAEYMRPNDIVKAREASSCAFIPISPSFEWHSYHLPLAVDSLIAEESSKKLAEHFNGIYFRTLSCGLDVWRNDSEKEMWGLTEDTFGMNFKDVPLQSEYATKDDLARMLENRLDAVRGSGFNNIFVVNHHGGKGQQDTVDEVCAIYSKSHQQDIFTLNTARLCSIGKEREGIQFRVGGHAGLVETLYVMGFRPDLVNTDELPEGALRVNETGILHSEADIAPEFNPRNCTQADADAVIENLMGNMIKRVEELIS